MLNPSEAVIDHRRNPTVDLFTLTIIERIQPTRRAKDGDLLTVTHARRQCSHQTARTTPCDGSANSTGFAGHQPLADLRDVLSRLALPDPADTSELDALLPDVWLKSHPDSRRAWSH